MTSGVVSFVVIFGLSIACAAKSTCSPTETFDEPVKARDNVSRLLNHAENGNTDAQFQLALMYETGCGTEQDYREAVRWYRKAADSGHPGAQNNLGGLYLRGLGVEQSDVEAMKWYLRAALEGNPAAENNVGYMCETGRVASTADQRMLTGQSEAVKWYRKAAKSGYAAAEFNLGLAYFRGVGVPQDARKAISWLRKAAGHRSAAAENLLGFAYEQGRGVPQDYGVAGRWYRAALEHGFAGAQQNLSVLESLLHKVATSTSGVPGQSFASSTGRASEGSTGLSPQ